MTPLVDRFGRTHTYLRVSVTDRCNYRCVYCMPAEGFEWMPRENLLSYEEVARLVRVFSHMGIRRVRLTGGEPLVRRDLELLVRELGAISGLTDIALTTNCYRLADCAEELARAGLSRINVSLDSLDPQRFSEMTRGGKLEKVLAGIEAAVEAGLTPVKINAVVLAGVNEEEIIALVERFSGPEYVLRFIEYMPFDARWHRCIPGRELRRRLRERWELEPSSEKLGDGPAVNWVLSNGARVGFISPLSEKFCSTCNRLRLAADGHLRTCLSDDGTPSLRDYLRGGASDEEIALAIRAMVMSKREGHLATEEGGVPFEGVMTRVGG